MEHTLNCTPDENISDHSRKHEDEICKTACPTTNIDPETVGNNTDNGWLVMSNENEPAEYKITPMNMNQ